MKLGGGAAILVALSSCHDEGANGTSPVPAVPTVSPVKMWGSEAGK